MSEVACENRLTLVLFFITRLVDSLVKNDPLNLIITRFEMPVHHTMSWWVPIPDSVEGGQKQTSFSNINSKEAVWFILSSQVDNSSPD